MGNNVHNTESYKKILDWFEKNQWEPFEYQKETWNSYLENYSGLINAPTGSGKTYAGFLGALIEELVLQKNQKSIKGLKVLWITPLRSLAKDIRDSMQKACDDLEVGWSVELRTGDTSSKDKRKQVLKSPDVLVTTPESLHVLLAQKGYPDFFNKLRLLVVDEWHELMGNKRGIQVELAISRLVNLNNELPLRIFGISATIGNLNDAASLLLKPLNSNINIIKADIEKKLEINTVYPDEIERYSWTGHLGVQMINKAIEIIEKSNTTLIFTNTRNQSEIWYKKFLELKPELEKDLGLHHGSISSEDRLRIEDQLHNGTLKAVVATSSLDLGVDFRPVDTVIQVGSPKGVARFLQRAGRSGHGPGETSRVYFIPTNSLELLEASSLKSAIQNKVFESKDTLDKPFDVLIQYLVTLAVSEGFKEKEIYKEVTNTLTYGTLKKVEWEWLLKFITQGGNSLKNYNEYNKVEVVDGIYKVTNRRIAMRHKLSIGTITSDPMVSVVLKRGGTIGMTEESFIAKLNPGDNFWFSGRHLEFIRIKETTAYVKPATRKAQGVIPSWSGGRMPLSTELSDELKLQLEKFVKGNEISEELKKLSPLLNLQNELSKIPERDELLIETFKSNEGYHVFIYPFLGRIVHEGLSALIAYKLSKLMPISFSFAMNDYGFELLSDKQIPIFFDEDNTEKQNESSIKILFDTNNLVEDILKSVNSSEMAKRRFRDIARIAGLIFQGYPGERIKFKNLQMSSSLLFEVFRQYEPESLIFKQAFTEVINQELNELKIKSSLDKMRKQKIILRYLEKPSPFSFPIIVDSMRDKMTSEKLEDRIRKMTIKL